MNQMPWRLLLIISIFLGADAGWLLAQGEGSTAAVTCREDKILARHGAEWTPLTEEISLPGGIKVFTNGTFQVKEGKIRPLKEGQILRADGNLLNPDGSIMPVFDHLALHKGRVTVYKDGEARPLDADMTLPDGTVIHPDGAYERPGGRNSRLVDGQLISLQGVPLHGLDTINLRNGRVVVFKAGAFISLQNPEQIMGMYSGTLIRGDGLVTFRDGATKQLTNGETITVTGVRADF
jgi:hypothetical protein